MYITASQNATQFSIIYERD